MNTLVSERIRARPAGHRRRRSLLLAGMLAVLVSLPALSVFGLALFPAENIWPHLWDTVLWEYVSTTFLLALGVTIGTVLIGVPVAWLVTHFQFPLRGFLSWALLLPFAVPAYVIAYVYTDLLEYAGPVQQLLRSVAGYQSARDYWFPSIRSLPGAILMMTLVLYPYVYMLARSAFLEQSTSVLEVARVLGRGRYARFLRVALPIARPAIVVGVSMALMETLNDFGTVEYFAVRTLSAGVYDVWLGMGNLGGGAQIAALLLLFVIVLLLMERFARRQQRHFQPPGSRYRDFRRIRLQGLSGAVAMLACLIPVILGFMIPAVVLLRYSIIHFEASWTADFRQAAMHTLLLASIAALVTVIAGVGLALVRRSQSHWLMQGLVMLASTGYAIPGAVLAIGIMVPFGWLDNTVDALFRSHFGISTGLLLSGTVFALLFAYCVRFLAVAFGSIDASLGKISPSMGEAAQTLGAAPMRVIRQIHLPMMSTGLLTALLVVFVDCMKELPATLVMRPFNFDTLATHIYQYASDELIEQAALGALLMVGVGVLPVILLSRVIDQSRTG